MLLKVFGLGAALTALWLALSGKFSALFLLLGAASVVLVVVLSRRMGIPEAGTRRIRVLACVLGYWPWLAREVWCSNIKVARLILDPRLPIEPTIARVPASQRMDLTRVVYANSITLTPGTLSLSVDDGGVTVHALTRSSAQNLLAGEMDRRVRALELDP